MRITDGSEINESQAIKLNWILVSQNEFTKSKTYENPEGTLGITFYGTTLDYKANIGTVYRL